jgi:hypothetical protein
LGLLLHLLLHLLLQLLLLLLLQTHLLLILGLPAQLHLLLGLSVEGFLRRRVSLSLREPKGGVIIVGRRQHDVHRRIKCGQAGCDNREPQTERDQRTARERSNAPGGRRRLREIRLGNWHRAPSVKKLRQSLASWSD